MDPIGSKNSTFFFFFSDPCGCTEEFFGNEKRAPGWLGYIGDDISYPII